jgi:hypothetical protein
MFDIFYEPIRTNLFSLLLPLQKSGANKPSVGQSRLCANVAGRECRRGKTAAHCGVRVPAMRPQVEINIIGRATGCQTYFVELRTWNKI